MIDKSTWPAGPWQAEPDTLEWEHAGFRCELVRHPEIGAWWGWVWLDSSHPLYDQPLSAFEDFTVHGGVNVVAKVEKTGLFMVSFDCAHCFDAAPAVDGALAKLRSAPRIKQLLAVETYRTFEYAKEQAESLAEQLRDWAPESVSASA